MDKNAIRPRTITAGFGIIGTTMLGIGMVCTMVWTAFCIPGIFIGIAGIALAYPYCMITKKT